MVYRDIRFGVEAGVALIELDRPESMNAFTGQMGQELSEAYRYCDTHDEVRVVVLTGVGEAFCVGADMSSGAETFQNQKDAMPEFSASPVSMPAFEVRKPIIAALNGHAVGLGLTLALQCDLRFVAREGRYGVLQVRRGVMPDALSHWTLPRQVGMARAADILLTGRKFDGLEAVELGIASRALPAADVLFEAMATAREMATQTAPLSVALTKKLLWQSGTLTASETEHAETELHHHLMGKEDAVEGVMAFLERRTPRWTSSVQDDWPEWPEFPANRDGKSSVKE